MSSQQQSHNSNDYSSLYNIGLQVVDDNNGNLLITGDDIYNQTLISDIPDLYETEDIVDPICPIKLFTPDSNWSWFLLELSKEDKDYCFGYVVGLVSELGYFTLSEIEEVNGPLGLQVERDLSFQTIPLSKVKELEVD